jgi:hypothetical protein
MDRAEHDTTGPEDTPRLSQRRQPLQARGEVIQRAQQQHAGRALIVEGQSACIAQAPAGQWAAGGR